MANRRNEILELFNQGKRQCEIVRELNVPRRTVSNTVRRFKELGHAGDRPGRGRKRTVNVSKNLELIKEQLEKNPGISLRQIARETGISGRSVQRIAKTELGYQPPVYKLQKVLPETNEKKKCVKLPKTESP